MAITSNTHLPNFDDLVKQSSCTKSPDNNLLDGSGTVFNLRLVNQANITYFKLYDAFSPTYGTTGPDFQVAIAADTTMTVQCRQGITFSSACSAAAARQGGTGATGNDNPGGLAYTIFGGE
tara:strand:+ start:7565 stop:7927 length:363 start_codon:yes stop_codon:yes gene_type:complete